MKVTFLLLNPLTTNDDYSRQSVLKISSALAERVGQGEVGGSTALADSAWRLHVAAGYRMGLVSAGWPVLLFCTNECRKQSFHLVGAPLLAFRAVFSLEEHSLDREP